MGIVIWWILSVYYIIRSGLSNRDHDEYCSFLCAIIASLLTIADVITKLK
jgi:hypothetical protein